MRKLLNMLFGIAALTYGAQVLQREAGLLTAELLAPWRARLGLVEPEPVDPEREPEPVEPHPDTCQAPDGPCTCRDEAPDVAAWRAELAADENSGRSRMGGYVPPAQPGS